MRMFHDSRETFLQASHDCSTVVRHSSECLTTVVRYSCESLTTFLQVSHDVRANLDQFYFSQLSLEMVLFMSHICRIVQIAETAL